MSIFSEKAEQIRQAHAGLIHRVVIECNNPGAVNDLESILKEAEANEWKTLVMIIRKILAGDRNEPLLQNLDEEDHVIVKSILSGLQDPATLPDLDQNISPELAAPGIASIVYAARTGNEGALQLIGQMATQMSHAGGEMARIAALVRPLVTGERDEAVLCKGLNEDGSKLVKRILEELLKLEEAVSE